MKKSLLLLIIILTTAAVFPQQKEYFDSPFGGGGGFNAGWMFPNVDPLNNMIKNANVPEVAKNGMYTSGGSGFIYIGFIPGLRIGGMGFGGSASEQSSKDAGGYVNEVNYSMGGGGLTVEYTLPFVKRVGISLGLIIGGGSITVDAYSNQGGQDWSDMFNAVVFLPESNNASNLGPIFVGNGYHKTIKNSFWFVTPTLNVDIPFYRFLSFRVGAGYQFSFAEDWTVDNGQTLSNVPSDFNGKSFFVQAGLYVGFFSF